MVRSINFGTSIMINHKKRCDLRTPQGTSGISFPSTSSGAPSDTTGMNEAAQLFYKHGIPITTDAGSPILKKGYHRMLFGNIFVDGRKTSLVIQYHRLVQVMKKSLATRKPTDVISASFDSGLLLGTLSPSVYKIYIFITTRINTASV